MFRSPHYNEDPDIWYFGLVHFGDACVLVQRFRMCSAPGSPNDDFFQPVPDRRLVLCAVFELESVTACSVVGLSPREQRRRWPQCEWPPAVRAMRCSEIKDLTTIAAEAAFWSLGVGFLAKFENLLGMSMRSKSSLLEALLSLVMEILSLGESEALDILAQRMSMMGSNSKFQVDILGLDDAESVLDFHDRKVVKDEKKSADSDVADCRAFRRAFKDKRKEVRLALAKAKSKAKVKRHPCPPYPSLSAISHESAKRFIPEGTTIWRGHRLGSWHGECKPFKRVSGAPEREGSEKGALLYVLRCLWTGWRILNGVDFDQCPIHGLFEPGYDGLDV